MWEFRVQHKGEDHKLKSLLVQQNFEYDFPTEFVAIGPTGMWVLLIVWGD